MKKKLQVFVSSTFLDLQKERQAAVEAILKARHIPAGMELFTAGSESQLEEIKRWIDESDVYMLILGGRYGSVETDSGKSYTELEYDYALAQNKPFFSLVLKKASIEKKVREYGPDMIEQYESKKLDLFRERVTKRMCEMVDDPKDVKSAVLTALEDLQRKHQFSGWIPGSEVSAEISRQTEQLVRLQLENDQLVERVQRLLSAAQKPSVQAAPKPQLPTTPQEALAQLSDAVHQGLPRSPSLVWPYLELLRDALPAFDIDIPASGVPEDEQVLEAFERFLPLRNEFVDFVRLVAQHLDTEKTRDHLGMFFEQIAVHVEPHRSGLHVQLQLIVHELFLYAVAALLSVQNYDWVHDLTAREYVVQNPGSGTKLRVFGYLNPSFGNFERFRNARLKTERISVVADLIKERATRKDIPFEDVMQADYVLCLRSTVLPTPPPDPWMPHSLVYASHRSAAFPLFMKGETKRADLPVAKIFGMPNAAEVRIAFQAAVEAKYLPSVINFGISASANMAALGNIENLGTR